MVTIIQFCPSEAPRVGSVVDPVKLPPSTLITVQHLVVLYRTTSVYVCRGPKSGPYAPSPNCAMVDPRNDAEFGRSTNYKHT